MDDEAGGDRVAALLSGLVPELSRLGYSDFLQGNQKVLLTQIENAAAQATKNPDGSLDGVVAQRKTELSAWARSCHSLVLAAGALGSAAASNHASTTAPLANLQS